MRCAACGREMPIDRSWKAGVTARNGTGQTFRLCKRCATAAGFMLQAFVKAMREGA